ncbi:uncharacterized protein LOC121479138 [Vulpes lagopus]|uniref:uncharacterized protein LOC121479138 n=1 Tax=Vulpes lagopus TaxID=494514 RepID=UPI001BC91491|nr:uncharacterized protein LOC121479138 [Vulpes lagopus]
MPRAPAGRLFFSHSNARARAESRSGLLPTGHAPVRTRAPSLRLGHSAPRGAGGPTAPSAESSRSIPKVASQALLLGLLLHIGALGCRHTRRTRPLSGFLSSQEPQDHHPEGCPEALLATLRLITRSEGVYCLLSTDRLGIVFRFSPPTDIIESEPLKKKKKMLTTPTPLGLKRKSAQVQGPLSRKSTQYHSHFIHSSKKMLR